MSNSFYLGYLVGIFCTVVAMLLTNHSQESGCQTDNDVADCTWVLEPTPAYSVVRDVTGESQ